MMGSSKKENMMKKLWTMALLTCNVFAISAQVPSSLFSMGSNVAISNYPEKPTKKACANVHMPIHQQVSAIGETAQRMFSEQAKTDKAYYDFKAKCKAAGFATPVF